MSMGMGFKGRYVESTIARVLRFMARRSSQENLGAVDATRFFRGSSQTF